MTSEKARIADAIRDAGYDRSGRLGVETEKVLGKLPKRKLRTAQDKVLMAAAIAAALTVFCAFGMPKVVEAAEALYRRLMGDQLQQRREYLDLPLDEKLRQAADSAYASHRENRPGASTRFRGVTITLTHASLRAGQEAGRGDPAGSFSCELAFSAIPPFDPHWVDFSLSHGGARYPMQVTDSVKLARERFPRAATEADWLDPECAFERSTWIEDGVPKYSVSVPLPDWELDRNADMVLEGVIDGERFEIPFTFDLAEAYADAAEGARRSVDYDEAQSRERLDVLNKAAAVSAPVGYQGESMGVRYAITELSRLGDELWTTASFPDSAEGTAKLSGMSYFQGGLCVDGHWASADTWCEAQQQGGVYTAINHWYLPLDLEWPEESLIMMELRLYSPDVQNYDTFDLNFRENIAHPVFRFNWKTNTATLPKDAAEDAAWRAEAEARQARAEAAAPELAVYRPSGGGDGYHNLGGLEDGVSVDVYQVTVRGRRLTVEHAVMLDGPEYAGHALELIEPELTVDGARAALRRVRRDGDQPRYGEYELPEGAAAKEGSKLALTLPIRITLDGKLIREQLRTIEFALPKPEAR